MELGTPDGILLGARLWLGFDDGTPLGADDGICDGPALGKVLGTDDGSVLGVLLGITEGASLGIADNEG